MAGAHPTRDEVAAATASDRGQHAPSIRPRQCLRDAGRPGGAGSRSGGDGHGRDHRGPAGHSCGSGAACAAPASQSTYVHEWEYGCYERQIDLPAGSARGVEASLANGQLAIRVLRGDYTAGSDHPADGGLAATRSAGPGSGHAGGASARAPEVAGLAGPGRLTGPDCHTRCLPSTSWSWPPRRRHVAARPPPGRGPPCPIGRWPRFHPAVAAWFLRRFPDGPTEPQARGWPLITSGRDTLIAAPDRIRQDARRFLVAIDALYRAHEDGVDVEVGARVVYVSPLRALAVDIAENLAAAAGRDRRGGGRDGFSPPNIRVAVRTGDTTSAPRSLMVRTASQLRGDHARVALSAGDQRAGAGGPPQASRR